MGSFSGVIAGAGQALQQVGQQLQKDWSAESLERMREEAASARQAALIDAQKSMQGAGFAHSDKTLGKTQEFQVLRDATAHDSAKEIQRNQIDSSEGIQERSLAHAAEMQGSQQAFTGAENDKNRVLENKRIGIAGGQLSIAKEQFQLAKQQAAIAIESGELDLKQKKRIEDINESVADATTPAELDTARGKLYAALGKDRFLVTKDKDAMGNETTVMRDAHTGRPIADADPTTGAQWDARTGRVMLDGSEVGRAKTQEAARAIIAAARSKPATSAPVAPPPPPPVAPAQGMIAGSASGANTGLSGRPDTDWLTPALAYNPRNPRRGLLQP